MRVLLVAPSSHTRLHHLVPLGWALRTAGHAVLIAARPAFTEAVTAAGFVAVAVGTDAPDGSDSPGAASGDSADGARLAEQADVDGLVAHGERWRPDLVLWDAHAPAGATAAGLLGAARVRVVGPFDSRPGADGDPVDRTAGERAGGERVAGERVAGERADGDGTLDCLPPSLRRSEDADNLSVRLVPYTGPDVIPAWLQRTPRTRRIYVAPDVPDSAIPALFDAAAGTDAELICELSQDRIPPGVQLPAQARLFDSVPAGTVLASCVGVVHGGGTALAMAALSHGLPQLTLLSDSAAPGAGIAQRLAQHGAGLLSDPARLDAAVIGQLAGDSPAREKARLLLKEMTSMPTPREVVPELVGIATGR
ncbi:nucleotide disphospho-sugar-binding domain-containing protein [Streptomyces sp. NPDC006645]|uniref:nucleotide disphospho-sugar-binding domain-containing protein n=1 Tax=unclassified Streptomyces TaxID=2593676 RepID=UPI0033A33E3F